ncbi:MAG TPA: glycine cleavage T C-terminal barrel domain-containing protein, partial [Pirellulales bacterium]
GYLLVCPREQGGVWLDKLRAAGARACGRPSWETVRVEAGLPVFGIDVTDENLAQEVDRNNSAISLTKGCYLGQETVARIDALGHVNKLLRGVRFAGETPPPAGTELRRGEKVVGRVSSAVWSPNFGVVALAFVRREAAAAGTELESASGPATVAALPFVE